MNHQILFTSTLIVIFVTISILIGNIPTESLVAFVGDENIFILMFVLGLVGGLTTFSGIPYHLILMSLASAGASPILLGIVTASGVMIGDSVTYGLGKRAGKILGPRVKNILNHLKSALETHPQILTPALILYGTISPFSNDFVVASLSFMGYTYKKVIIPLTIGNVFYNTALAYLGYYYYDTIISWFI